MDTARSELKQLKDELAARDRFIDNLPSQLEENEQAITKLENQLSGTVAELKDRDMEPAKLKSELEAREEDKQLSFFSTPEPEPTPEPTPTPTPETETETENIESPSAQTPESNPEQIDFTGTVGKGGLLEYINKNFPGSKINGKQITNAVYRGGKFLSKLEAKYGFKFIGTLNREYRYRINP